MLDIKLFKIFMIINFSTHKPTKPTELNIQLREFLGHIGEIMVGNTMVILKTTVLLTARLSFSAKQSSEQIPVES